jgi:hypothetical protein
MVEVHLTLTYDAIKALACGEKLSSPIEGENLVVVLVASPEATDRFKNAAQQVALMFAPVGPNAH